MNNIYEVKKSVDKIRHGRYTFFLTPNIYKKVSYVLKDNEYNIYYPYPDSDKIILYTDKIPVIRLFEIESYFNLTHREILGSLFSIGINSDVFGDIIVDGDKYYFYVMDEISDFILNNFSMIGNKPIRITEVDINTLANYMRKYNLYEIIVSSLRIDCVISRIIGTSRDKVHKMIKDKLIMINYEILSCNSYIIKDNDVFSIRKYGKYKFIGICNRTKKDNYVIKYLKYL